MLSEYIIRLNNKIDEIIETHGLKPGGEAVKFIYGVNSGNVSRAIRSSPVEQGVLLIDSMKSLYLKGFNRYVQSSRGPLHFVCEMMWDQDTIEYTVQRNESHLQKAFEVMEFALNLSNRYCIASAIHGLGHMAFSYQTPVHILNAFLERDDIDEGLRRYAMEARTGMIL